MPKWCYSFDGSVFHDLVSETREQAIVEARSLADGRKQVWIGESTPIELPSISYDDIRNLLDCSLMDSVGEVAEDWPDLNSDQQNALESELNQVLIKHLTAAGEWPPQFYQVLNPELIPSHA